MTSKMFYSHKDLKIKTSQEVKASLMLNATENQISKMRLKKWILPLPDERIPNSLLSVSFSKVFLSS